MATIEKVAVPSLAGASPRYAEAVAKVAKLEGRLASLDQRLDKTNSDLSELLNGGDAAARALLDSDDMAAVATGGAAGLIAERDRLAGDQATTLRAIDLARGEVRQARGEASAEICKGLLPAYRAHVDRLARALLAAYAAHRDLEALTDSLDEGGIGWAGFLPPAQVPYLRDVAHDDQFPAWLREVREHGLTTVELPDGWARAWGMRPLGAPAVRLAANRR